MWKQYNPNPDYMKVGDCTVRAISKALGQDWETTYLDLCVYGLMLSDMPSANHVWGAYLHSKGYERHLIDDVEQCTYNVRQFAADHPTGTYILALSGHVVCVKDGDYFDTWDCGYEVPVYYWQKKGD